MKVAQSSFLSKLSVVIFAEIKTKLADVILKMTTVFERNERTLVKQGQSGGFQFLLILDRWGISFDAVVVLDR